MLDMELFRMVASIVLGIGYGALQVLAIFIVFRIVLEIVELFLLTPYILWKKKRQIKLENKMFGDLFYEKGQTPTTQENK